MDILNLIFKRGIHPLVVRIQSWMQNKEKVLQSQLPMKDPSVTCFKIEA